MLRFFQLRILSKVSPKDIYSIQGCLPSVNNMAKKRIAHNGEMGSLVTRSGYAMKARPVPPFTTSFTSTPNSFARNPRIENIANPANTDVRQLPKHTIIVSLITKDIK